MTYGRQVLGERTAPRIRSAEGRGNVVMRMGTQQQQPDNNPPFRIAENIKKLSIPEK